MSNHQKTNVQAQVMPPAPDCGFGPRARVALAIQVARLHADCRAGTSRTLHTMAVRQRRVRAHNPDMPAFQPVQG